MIYEKKPFKSLLFLSILLITSPSIVRGGPDALHRGNAEEFPAYPPNMPESDTRDIPETPRPASLTPLAGHYPGGESAGLPDPEQDGNSDLSFSTRSEDKADMERSSSTRSLRFGLMFTKPMDLIRALNTRLDHLRESYDQLSRDLALLDTHLERDRLQREHTTKTDKLRAIGDKMDKLSEKLDKAKQDHQQLCSPRREEDIPELSRPASAAPG